MHVHTDARPLVYTQTHTFAAEGDSFCKKNYAPGKAKFGNIVWQCEEKRRRMSDA